MRQGCVSLRRHYTSGEFRERFEAAAVRPALINFRLFVSVLFDRGLYFHDLGEQEVPQEPEGFQRREPEFPTVAQCHQRNIGFRYGACEQRVSTERCGHSEIVSQTTGQIKTLLLRPCGCLRSHSVRTSMR